MPSVQRRQEILREAAEHLQRISEGVNEMQDAIARLTGDTCAECGRSWTDPLERWRTYLTIDNEPALYCPECSRKEFQDG